MGGGALTSDPIPVGAWSSFRKRFGILATATKSRATDVILFDTLRSSTLSDGITRVSTIINKFEYRVRVSYRRTIIKQKRRATSIITRYTNHWKSLSKRSLNDGHGVPARERSIKYFVFLIFRFGCAFCENPDRVADVTSNGRAPTKRAFLFFFYRQLLGTRRNKNEFFKTPNVR